MVPLKWLLGHDAHVRSDAAVGSASLNLPGAQGSLTGLQTPPSFASEYVATPSHAPHVRSDVSVPATVWPSPIAHTCHAVQPALPDLLV